VTRSPARSDRAGGRVRLSAHAAAFGRATGWGYFPIAFAGRLPFAMMIVGILTVVVSERDSVAEAGLVAAAAGIGTASSGTFAGSLADRFGQRPVLLVTGAAGILAAGALLLAVYGGASVVALAIVAALLGASTPQVAPFSRSRLVGVARRPAFDTRRDRAISWVMSYESVMDEASFVLGPVLVGVLTAFIAPWAPLALSVLLTATAVVAFALHPTAAATPPATAGDRTAGAVFTPQIVLLVVAMFLVGGVFGSTLTALTGFMRARGLEAESGIVYGAMSVGAIVIAIGVAAIPPRVGLPARWLGFGVLGLAGCAVLAVASTIPAAVAGLVLSGCGIGAVLVTLFSLGAQAAPEGRSTTVLTTLQSTLVVGQALVTAISGAIVEANGATAGFGTTVGIVAVLVVLAVVNRRAFGVRTPARSSTATR
jgi:MFS family permease